MENSSSHSPPTGSVWLTICKQAQATLHDLAVYLDSEHFSMSAVHGDSVYQKTKVHHVPRHCKSIPADPSITGPVQLSTN